MFGNKNNNEQIKLEGIEIIKNLEGLEKISDRSKNALLDFLKEVSSIKEEWMKISKEQEDVYVKQLENEQANPLSLFTTTISLLAGTHSSEIEKIRRTILLELDLLGQLQEAINQARDAVEKRTANLPSLGSILGEN